MFIFEVCFVNCLLCVGVLFICLYIYLTRHFKYWKNKGVVFKKPLPFFGNYAKFLLMRSSLGDIYKEVYEEFSSEKFVGMFKTSRPDLMLCDPDLIKYVFIKDFQIFQERDDEVSASTEKLNVHLFFVKGERWRIMRHKFTPIFTSSKLKDMFHLIVEKAEEFQNLIEQTVSIGDNEEIRNLFSKFTADVIGSCAFGVTMNSMIDENAPFRKMGRKVFEPTFKRQVKTFFRFMSPKMFDFLKLRIHDICVERFFLSVVKEIVEKRKHSKTRRHDFIDLMIDLKEKNLNDNESFEFTDEFLTAQAYAFFVAGFETSSTLMSFALYELALQPEIQQKAQSEIDFVLKKFDGKLTYESILEMKYLSMVISETQRKYPALGVLTRVCNSTYTFPGTNLTIEKGVSVTIPVNALHYDPKYYPDPEKFIPDRFTDEAIQSRHSMVFLPFGEGPRNCIGLRFGKIQSTVGLATFLRRYSVEATAKTERKIIINPKSFVTASKNGIWLKINKRQ